MIVTAVEEFGISAVEAQAAGRPVIARAAGGVLETVIEGETGHLWAGGPDDLVRAVLEFDDAAIDPEACRAQAARFSQGRFRERMLETVGAAIAQPPIHSDGSPRPSWTATASAVPMARRSRQAPVTAGLIGRAVRDPHR